jgi:hypothetical protein
MIKRKFRGGIHLCFMRYTWRQELKNLVRYMEGAEW